jgi:hypothetical protein
MAWEAMQANFGSDGPRRMVPIPAPPLGADALPAAPAAGPARAALDAAQQSLAVLQSIGDDLAAVDSDVIGTYRFVYGRTDDQSAQWFGSDAVREDIEDQQQQMVEFRARTAAHLQAAENARDALLQARADLTAAEPQAAQPVLDALDECIEYAMAMVAAAADASALDYASAYIENQHGLLE